MTNIPAITTPVQEIVSLPIDTWTPDFYTKYVSATCKKESDNLSYLYMGLNNENGEVLGKFKKTMRDGAKENTASDVLAEVGDVVWYACNLLRIAGYGIPAVWPGDTATTYDVLADYTEFCHNNILLFATLSKAAAACITTVEDGGYCRLVLVDTQQVILTLTLLDVICRSLGSDLQHVARANAIKLTKRYQNNTISGNGDNR